MMMTRATPCSFKPFLQETNAWLTLNKETIISFVCHLGLATMTSSSQRQRLTQSTYSHKGLNTKQQLWPSLYLLSGYQMWPWKSNQNTSLSKWEMYLPNSMKTQPFKVTPTCVLGQQSTAWPAPDPELNNRDYKSCKGSGIHNPQSQIKRSSGQNPTKQFMNIPLRKHRIFIQIKQLFSFSGLNFLSYPFSYQYVKHWVNNLIILWSFRQWKPVC